MDSDSFYNANEPMSFFKSEGNFILKFALRKPHTVQLYVKFFGSQDTYRETVGKWPAEFFKNGYIVPKNGNDPSFFEFKTKLDELFEQNKKLLCELAESGSCNREVFLSRKRAAHQSAYAYFMYVIERDYEHKLFGKSTKNTYETVLNTIKDFLGRPLLSYTKQSVLNLRAENRLNMPMTERVLRRCFRAALEDELIMKHPYKSVKAKVPKKRIYSGAVEKAEKIEAAYQKGLFKGMLGRYAKMFVFSFQTGRRFSEIVNLNEKDISQGFLHIVPKKTEETTGNDVAQKLTDLALSCLDFCDSDGYFFKDVYQSRFPSTSSRDICKIAGVEHLNFHGARAVFATRFMRIPGANISDLADMLCVDEQTALRYIQRDKKRANLLMQEFDKYN